MNASDELRELLWRICSAADPNEVVKTLGADRPSDTSLYVAHVEPTAYAAFRALDFRPWTADDFGLVEIRIDNGATVRVGELEQLLGPLSPVPRLHGGPHRLQGIFERPSLPAWAAIYLELDGQPGDERVTAITIRTEPEVAEE